MVRPELDREARRVLIDRVILSGVLLGAGAGPLLLLILLAAEPVLSFLAGEVTWRQAWLGLPADWALPLLAGVAGAGVGFGSGLLAGLSLGYLDLAWSVRRLLAAGAAVVPLLPLVVWYDAWWPGVTVVSLTLLAAWLVIGRILGTTAEIGLRSPSGERVLSGPPDS